MKAWWFNPRDGSGHGDRHVREHRRARIHVSPTSGEMIDWVLVLDDASKNYPPPGTRKNNK